MKHIMAILRSVFSLGYHGKTIDFERYSPYHRTTVAHFLNKGKWNDAKLEDILKNTIIQFLYKEAQLSGKPVLCIALNYAIVMYDKSRSKIKIVQDIADELPHRLSPISFVTAGIHAATSWMLLSKRASIPLAH